VAAKERGLLKGKIPKGIGMVLMYVETAQEQGDGCAIGLLNFFHWPVVARNMWVQLW